MSSTIQWIRRSAMVACGLSVFFGMASSAAAQNQRGRIAGTVALESTGEPLHAATVVIVGLGKAVLSDDTGSFEITDVPAGTYDVVATREHLTSASLAVTVSAEGTATANFKLSLSPVHEEVTVTANLGVATTYEAFNAVRVLDGFDLAKDMAGTLGEVLDGLPGVSKRSFGTGNSRPIIRGFDGDRVLILENGMRTGDISSQSGDHNVSIDPAALERVEVVRGPATLLYGSNAIGGVVNAITPHEMFETGQLSGVHGQAVTEVGSANGQAAANANVHVGQGSWGFWAGGGSRRTGDYDTPAGQVPNSASKLTNGRVGFGATGAKGFATFGFQAEDGRFGIPFAGLFEGEEDATISVDTQRQVARFDLGAKNLTGPASHVRFILNYTRWRQDEVESEGGGPEVIGTSFKNDVVGMRAEMTQRPTGRLGGKLGVSLEHRDFESAGAEALAPKTTQNAMSVFAYEELSVGRARVQFGGRIERNAYSPEARGTEEIAAGEPVPPEALERTFTGVSGSAGLRMDLSANAALVVNLSHSFRAPALEELYNFGPHVGNLAFEIGNPNLEREASTGLDVSLRGRGSRARAEVNAFTYGISNFVFPDFTGEELDGLRAAVFNQGDSRFTGFDGSVGVEVMAGAWLNVGFGYVNATLTDDDTPLPRIPPLRGNVRFDLPVKGFTFSPEVEWAARQDRVYFNETETDRWTTVNLSASYSVVRAHISHQLNLRGFNLTNEAYRNHTSFIKDLAQEIGRGVKLSYSVRFF